jgi:uncharacterized protein YhbP (UPF0306 family)
MSKAAELARQYLQKTSTMQLATVSDGQPWVCTVRFLADEDNNLYWASIPTRRHSLEIAEHPQVACAIVVQDDVTKPVIGIQAEGTVEVLETPLKCRSLVERYANTFHRDTQWVEDFIAGNTGHRLYKFTPTTLYVIDEENLPAGVRHKA